MCINIYRVLVGNEYDSLGILLIVLKIIWVLYLLKGCQLCEEQVGLMFVFILIFFIICLNYEGFVLSNFGRVFWIKLFGFINLLFYIVMFCLILLVILRGLYSVIQLNCYLGSKNCFESLDRVRIGIEVEREVIGMKGVFYVCGYIKIGNSQCFLF